jgi:hypothetical protein
VEGYSNPAWVAILVVGRWLGLFDRGTLFGITDVVLFPKLVALGCCLGIFTAMFAIARVTMSRPVVVTIVAGTATAMVPSFVIWVVSGLENALYALSVMLLTAVLATSASKQRLLSARTGVVAGLVTALAVLTRPEGILFLAAFPVATAMSLRRASLGLAARSTVAFGIAFAIPTGGYLLWRMAIFGDYLPNTARAKQQNLTASAVHIGRVGELTSYVGTAAVVAGAVIVAVALLRKSTARTTIPMLLIPLGLTVLGFVTLQPDWMKQLRFATPVWPLATLLIALAVAEVMRRDNIWVRGITIAVMVIVAASIAPRILSSDRAFRANPTVGLCRVALSQGYLFNGFADILNISTGSLLSADAGGNALVSRLRFVDLAGLTDQRIARFWQDDDMPGLRDYLLHDVRPTFFIVFAGWTQRAHLRLAEDRRFQRDYVLLFAGERNGGEWVRRDALPAHPDLARAAQWGRSTWKSIAANYRQQVPPQWSCGNTLRPTPFHPGSPAASPLTALPA